MPPLGKGSSRAHSSERLRRYLRNLGTLVLSTVIVVWTLAPLYNMVLISLEPEGDVFTDHIWPRVPSVESFWGVLTQGHWYLEHFWRQFANSLYIAPVTIRSHIAALMHKLEVRHRSEALVLFRQHRTS